MRSQDEGVDFAESVAIDLFVSSAETNVDTRQVAKHEVQATGDRVAFRGSSKREVFAVLFLQRTCSHLGNEGMRLHILDALRSSANPKRGGSFWFLADHGVTNRTRHGQRQACSQFP